MEKRRLGKSDLLISPFAFGGNVFGWTADAATSFKLLDAYTDAGLNFVDTADVYNWGSEDSESIIGKWIKQGGKRDKIVLATKLGNKMSETQKGLSKKYMVEAIEASLRRLQTDYIDLYQAHIDDPETPQQETLEAFDQLVKQGKVRVIGASNFTSKRLASALDVSEQNNLARYESIQPQYNLYDRSDFEKDLQQLCIDRQVGVITYFSLASGFLTGKYRSAEDTANSARKGGVQRYLNDRGFRILDALDTVSKEYNAKPGQIALAWLMAQPGITAAIASATSIPQLNELVAALNIQLKEDALQLLSEASAV